MPQLRIVLLTLFSLIAFAANSLITRFALEDTAIDEASFTMLRITSGAIFLWLYIRIHKHKKYQASGSWLAAIALFLYAVSFTYGYRLVTAGTGALLLFGSVQITMTIMGYREGERLNLKQIIGFALALFGLVILILPGLTSPSLTGASLMCISGIAWSFYSLKGRNSIEPSISTANNFIKAAPMTLMLWLIVYMSSNSTITVPGAGVIYALLSGIVTSALGYIIWYCILPELKATQAAIVQLSVPIIVTLAGALFLSEEITLRVFIASVTIFLGTLIVLNGKRQY